MFTADKLAADVRDLIRERGAESAMLVGHDWGGSAAWTAAMNHPEVVDRLAILNAAHPRKLNEGLRHPSQLARSWYFFYFALPDLPEHHVRAKDWEFFQHFLRDAQPPYSSRRPSAHRGVVAGGRGGRDDRLLPRRGAPPKGTRRSFSRFGAHPGDLGEQDRYLGPDLAEPHAEDVANLTARAPARRVALGAPRRGRARNRCSSTSSAAARPT